MGTHPSGPARLLAEEGTTLNAWLERHPAALGDAVRQRFGGDLPFLFKVTPAGPSRIIAATWSPCRSTALGQRGVFDCLRVQQEECKREAVEASEAVVSVLRNEA